uniref:Ubiquitin-like protease family profile domain-containing protein n=1 Tax=Oryza rufipogon TaxID=4529 RepID=A0A0E0R633_ORYRU
MTSVPWHFRRGMASDRSHRTSSDDECSSNSKSDNKVADSDYANSISEEEETSDSDKNITKKDLVSTLKDLDRSKGKEHTKLEYDQDKSGSAESPKPRSRLNITYFSNLIEGLSNEQRSIIEKSAFGSLLNFQRCAIPLSFVKWIASHTDVSCLDIVINGRSIPINPNTTNFILGIPNGGLEIKHDNDAGKHFFHQHYGSTKPLISFFGTKFLSDKGVNKLSEDDVLRCFMIKAMEKLSYDAICSGARCIEQQGNNSNISLMTFPQLANSTTTREEKSGEEKSKGGSKQGGSNVAHNENVTCSQLQTTPPSKPTEQENSKSNSNKDNACKETQHANKKASNKDFVCSQQSNNSVASRTRAKRLHSASPLSVVSISPSKKNSSDQKIRKAVRKQPLKATQPTSTQPDKEESNKDGIFVEPICTIPAKKEEVQPTKDLESNSTEFVIDIEGPYDVEDITGHTMDKTKFILVIYSNSSEDHKSQDPTQDESDNIPHKSTNGERYKHTPKTCINNKDGVQHLSANFTANMGNRRLEGQHCDENEYQDDFAEFLYEEEPSDNIDMVEQRAQPQINNEQSSPQTPLHINIASARTPATKQSSQSSPDIGINSPRIAQMREPNQHAQTEERQYSMTRIIDSLNASGNCSGTRHNLYRPKRIVHPSKYKSSPYDSYTRHQTISAAELNHYNNILSIVLMNNVKVTWSSLSKSLSPRGVVDTYVLNAYAKKIANDQNNKENEYRNFYFFHRTSVYFLKNWEGAGKEEDYENCARQAFTFARNKKPLHYYDLVSYFPMSV